MRLLLIVCTLALGITAYANENCDSARTPNAFHENDKTNSMKEMKKDAQYTEDSSSAEMAAKEDRRAAFKQQSFEFFSRKENVKY